MRSVFRAFLAVAVAATSVPVQAQEYFFRYKTDISTSPGTTVPGEEDSGFGVGNDITVFFTGALGYDFSRTIPVATHDVVEWKKTEGVMQPGLSLAAETGVISGTATGSSAKRVATLLGYDASGNAIARAAITFNFHDPVGNPQSEVFYGHTNKYMYREIPASVTVARWESLSELPGDFHLEGRYLVGTPTDILDESVAFIGYDYLGNEVAFAYGSLIVQDGPTFKTIADQSHHPDQRFEVGGSLQYRIGEPQYRLIALDGQPKSLAFSTKDVALKGYINTFSTALRFQIEAVDADGAKGVSNVFTLSTFDPDVELANLTKLIGTVGTEYGRQLSAKDLSGDQDWQILAGELPEGLTLDNDTGVISGVPVKEETQTGIVIAVSTSDGGYGESKPFEFRIFPEQVGVSFAAVNARVDESFATSGPTLGTGVIAPYAFSLADGADVDPSLTVDEAAAKVAGAVSTAGSYDVPFKLTNGDGREFVFNQPISVYNPLALSYASPLTVYRRVAANEFPTVADQSVIGSAAYEAVTGSLPDGLTINPGTGAVTGTARTMGTTTGLSVKITDESGSSATSNTFSVKVEDRPGVIVTPTGTPIERFVPNTVQAVTSQNVFDGVTYELVSGTLPQGISLGKDGQLTGKTEDAEGIYPGISIRATDGEGYSATSPVFDLQVVAPTGLYPLLESDGSSSWTVGVPFSITLPRPSNALGVLTYDISGLPDGVSVQNGALVGTIYETGDYPLQVTITDEAHRELGASFTLSILEPMTATLNGTSVQARAFSFLRAAVATAATQITVPRGSQTTVGPNITNGIEPITYAFTGTLPSGMSFGTSSIVGAPLVEGQTSSAAITVSDAAGTVVRLPADFKVGSRLPVELSYDYSSPIFKGSMSSKAPSVKNVIGSVEYKLTAGSLPEGLTLNEKTGYISGAPKVDGRFPDIVVTATDSEGDDFAGSTAPFEIGVSLRGLVGLALKTNITVRANESFLKTIQVGNVTKPLTFKSSSGVPSGVVLGETDGSLSGVVPTVGKQSFSVSVTDDFGRSRGTTVNLTSVGPLAIAAPKTLSFNQYATVSASPVVTNPIGATVYEVISGTLPDGLTLNPSTGAITGTASTKGTWPGIVLKLTDSTGTSVQTAAFTLTITDRLPLTVGTATSYAVFANLKYKMTVPVTNAVGKVAWTQTGTLPAGIVFDPVKGLFSGTATVIGTFPNISVTATDSVGGTATKTFSFVVSTNGKAITLNVSTVTTKVGYPISMTPTWSNTVGDVYLWADDTLAQYGLSIDHDTGVISGTAKELMDVAPNLHVTDASERITSKPIAIKVIPNLVINAPARIDLMVNSKMATSQPTADNVVGTVTRTVTGTLPTGVSFGSSGFTGTPTEMGSFPVVLTVKDTLGDTATANIQIVVANNGTPPTIALTPTASGYLYTAANITPTYTNKKSGDVVSLAPGSGSLPPGITIEQNSSGVYYLKKVATTVSDVGVYRNVNLRVTDTDGLYSETGPLAFVYASNPRLAYAAVSFSQRIDEPVSIAAPVPSAGVASADVMFSFKTDNTGGRLKIDPATGALSGFVDKTGTNAVTVVESYDGITIRSFTYNVTATALPLTVSLPDISAYVNEPLASSWVASVANSRGNGSWTMNSGPAWLSLDASSGRFSGTPDEVGTFPVVATYSDDYGSETLSLNVSVNSGGKGYKFVKVVITSQGQYRYGQVNTLKLFDENGADAVRIGTVVDQLQDWSAALDIDDTTAAQVNTKTTAGYVTLEFPYPIDFTKAYSLGANGGYTGMGAVGANSTIIVYGSDDGQTFTQIGTGKGMIDLDRKP